jgi:hypothetical protein
MLNWRQYKHVTDAYKEKDAYGTIFHGDVMWEDLKEQFGAYPDGVGNIWFDTEEGEAWFILKHARQNDYVD